MRRFLAFVTLSFLVTACGSVGRLDQGIIELGATQSQFINAWGLPDRQYLRSSDEFVSAGWKGTSGGFFKGKKAIQVWVYESRKTELAFGEDKKLVGYNTELSRQQLQDSFVGPKKSEM